MKKKNLKFIGTFLILIVLAGCAKTYDEDYTKTYKDFLDYTLGDWKVIDTENGTSEPVSTFDYTKHYIVWKIAYQDRNGKEQILHLSNNDPIMRSLQRHLKYRHVTELRETIGELPDSLTSIYLTDAQHKRQTLQEVAYKEHPEKLYENYKDILRFKDLTLEDVYKNSAIFLTLHFRIDTETMSEEEKELFAATEKKVLEHIPNANMIIRKFRDVYGYYIDGQKVNLEDHELYDTYAEENLYQKILRDRAPHFDIKYLVD